MTEGCEKRQSKISQKVKQPLTDRMLKYALMDNTNLVNEVEDEQCFSIISGKGCETMNDDLIKIADGGSTPNQIKRKANHTFVNTMKS